MPKPVKPMELAEIAGVSKSTVYRWLHKIHLTKLKHGRDYRKTGDRWIILRPENFISEFCGAPPAPAVETPPERGSVMSRGFVPMNINFKAKDATLVREAAARAGLTPHGFMKQSCLERASEILNEQKTA